MALYNSKVMKTVHVSLHTCMYIKKDREKGTKKFNKANGQKKKRLLT